MIFIDWCNLEITNVRLSGLNRLFHPEKKTCTWHDFMKFHGREFDYLTAKIDCLASMLLFTHWSTPYMGMNFSWTDFYEWLKLSKNQLSSSKHPTEKKTFWFKICTLHPYTKSGLICKHVIHDQKFLAVVAETLATTISQLKFSIRNSRFSFENVVVFITTQMCQFIHHYNAFLRERKKIHKKMLEKNQTRKKTSLNRCYLQFISWWPVSKSNETILNSDIRDTVRKLQNFAAV